MLKKSYSMDELMEEMVLRMMKHEDPAYRRSLFGNSYLTEKHLRDMILNDPDKNIKKEAEVELEKRIDSKRRRKRTTKKVDYFKMDLKGISIGNEDYEDLMEEKRSEKYFDNSNDAINKYLQYYIISK